jgi:DNA-binding NtrC family response regulator
MARNASILIVDDEFRVRETLRIRLKKSGYAVDCVGSGEEALGKLEETPFDIVLLEIKLPGMDGLEVLRLIKESYCSTLVVMMTASASIESAVEAMKEGAGHCLLKPLEPGLLHPLFAKLLQHRESLEENRLLKEQVSTITRFQNFIGRSPAIRNVFNLIRDVAVTDSSVLITGETGTGKEMVAKTIHAVSPRKDAPFIPINCGAFPEHLLESELFGHEKGAFTGAHQARRGRLELCRGGTLFLDEIAEISMRMQVDLLRVLEEKCFYRVGGETPVSVDFRIIAATNRNLRQAVDAGTFRADLFYRLNVISIHVPRLRNRGEDIPLLAQYFLDRFSKETKKHVDSFSKEVMNFLCGYPWPGNVRELQNAIERAVVLCKKRQLGMDDLAFLQAGCSLPSTDEKLDEVIRNHLERVLGANRGNISKAARVLGIHRSTLHKKINAYGISVGD